MFFYYDFNKVLYNSIYNTLSIDYNMFLYKNKNGSGYMEKKVNLEQKIIDLKLKSHDEARTPDRRYWAPWYRAPRHL